MDLLSLLASLPPGGSGTGVHYYMSRCPRQVKLDKIAPRESSYKARVGTIVHKLLELYYTRALVDVALPLDDHADFAHDPVQEALRVFSAYTKYFSPDEWTVLHAERKLPETEEQSRILGALLVDPFTFRPDAVVEISEAQAELFQSTRGVSVDHGRYIVDYKSTDKKDSAASIKWVRDPQLHCYIAAWNVLFPQEPVAGAIVLTMIRHADLHQRDKATGRLRSFETHFVAPPMEQDLLAYRQFFTDQKEYLASDKCNLAACGDWGGCSHYTTGRCNRLSGG